jgi:hypothetical protein
MSSLSAWALFILGIAHIVFGIVKFKAPLVDALSAGFIGQFNHPEVRRTAFWFTIFGVLVALAGHIAIYAVATGDLALLKIVGGYASVMSLVGVAALPKSPFWASLLISLFVLATGYGVVS